MRRRRWQSLLFGILAVGGCARGTLKLDDDPLTEVLDPVDAGEGPDDAPGEGPDPQEESPGQGDGDTVGDGDGAGDGDGPDQPPDDSGDAGPDAAPPEEPDPQEDAGPPVESECVPGTYVGSFAGKISVLSLINIDIEGEISIDALTASAGDVLTIDQGKVTGEDTEGNPVTADVSGTLDCETKQLMNGALTNGVYTRKLINQTVNFQGTVQAVYAPGTPPTVNGVWQTSGGIEMGSGNFTAQLASP